MHTGSVHHVAMGVQDLEAMRSFYGDTLGFSNVFMEIEKADHTFMREVLRAPHVIFSGVMFRQEAGGIALLLVRMVQPVPRAIRKDFRYGDIGVAKITIAVSDIERLYGELGDKVNFCSEPKEAVIPGWGDYHFVYCKDPEGNLLEFVSAPTLAVPGTFGGIRWVGIGVTDLERSLQFYQKYMGLDTRIIGIHETFSGLVDEVADGKGVQVRSCLLGNSKGGGMVELFEVAGPRGRSIPFGVSFGDFGYLQTCIYCSDMDRTVASCRNAGIGFLSEPRLMDDGIPEHTGSFVYVKDRDGIPVEFLVLHHQDQEQSSSTRGGS
jgi:catechol 2,3-dioxygenase-like lactoylglutathione lyase family enzyme